MWNNSELIVSIDFYESEDFKERVSIWLDIILKDLYSKWLLNE